MTTAGKQYLPVDMSATEEDEKKDKKKKKKKTFILHHDPAGPFQ